MEELNVSYDTVCQAILVGLTLAVASVQAAIAGTVSRRMPQAEEG